MKRRPGRVDRRERLLPVVTLIGTQLMAAAVFWMALPLLR